MDHVTAETMQVDSLAYDGTADKNLWEQRAVECKRSLCVLAGRYEDGRPWLAQVFWSRVYVNLHPKLWVLADRMYSPKHRQASFSATHSPTLLLAWGAILRSGHYRVAGKARIKSGLVAVNRI